MYRLNTFALLPNGNDVACPDTTIEGTVKWTDTIPGAVIYIGVFYKEQCNFEFKPEELKKLVDNKITLCISCYEDDSDWET